MVDKLGHIDDAIKSAAKMAKIKDYKVVDYPVIKDPFQSFLGGSDDNIKDYFAKLQFGQHYIYYKEVQNALQFTGIQARLPYTVSIK